MLPDFDPAGYANCAGPTKYVPLSHAQHRTTLGLSGSDQIFER